MKEVISTSKAAKGKGPYSQAIATKDFIFTSGQGALHPKTNEVVGESIIEQTRHTLNNLKNILESAGSSFDKVVKVNAYLADINDFNDFNEAYKEFFKAPYPARTTIGCKLIGIKVEIDLVALK